MVEIGGYNSNSMEHSEENHEPSGGGDSKLTDSKARTMIQGSGDWRGIVSGTITRVRTEVYP
jgi:hypothetical protein